MPDRAIDVVRRKLVALMRADPPGGCAGRAGPSSLERWLAARLTADEVAVLFRIEHQYGEAAMAEWFAEALLEAGVPPRRLAS